MCNGKVIAQFRIAQFPDCAVRVRITKYHEYNSMLLILNVILYVPQIRFHCYNVKNLFEGFESYIAEGPGPQAPRLREYLLWGVWRAKLPSHMFHGNSVLFS